MVRRDLWYLIVHCFDYFDAGRWYLRGIDMTIAWCQSWSIFINDITWWSWRLGRGSGGGWCCHRRHHGYDTGATALADVGCGRSMWRGAWMMMMMMTTTPSHTSTSPSWIVRPCTTDTRKNRTAHSIQSVTEMVRSTHHHPIPNTSAAATVARSITNPSLGMITWFFTPPTHATQLPPIPTFTRRSIHSIIMTLFHMQMYLLNDILSLLILLARFVGLGIGPPYQCLTSFAGYVRYGV